MVKNDLLSQLSAELRAAAADYRAEALEAVNDRPLLGPLARRCERFATEIRETIENSAGGDAESALAEESVAQPAARRKTPAREQTFARVEAREARLERLYREILRRENGLPDDLRGLLRGQSRQIRRWHDFVITEEINFILGGETRIPIELLRGEIKDDEMVR